MIVLTAFSTGLSCALASFAQAKVGDDAKIYTEVKTAVECREKFAARGFNPPTLEDLKNKVCTAQNNTVTNYDELISKCDSLIKHNPKMPDYYLLRGKVRYYKSFAINLAMFSETLIVSESSYLAKISLGEITAEIKDFSDALTINSTVKLNNTDAASAHLFRGKIYTISAAKSYSKQNLKNALIDFDETIKLDEYELPPDNFRKEIYLLSKDGDLVGQDFARRIRENPSASSRIYLERSRYLSTIVEYKKALADVMRYANSSNSDKDITRLTFLTIIKYAGEAYKRKTISSAEDYLEKASVEIESKKPDEAFNDATEAIKRNPRLTSAHVIRARALVDKNKIDEGIAEANVALTQDADNVGALCVRGIGLAVKNDIKTLDDLSRAISLDPELAFLYNAFRIRAKIYTALGKTDSAAADMQKNDKFLRKLGEIQK